MTDACRARPGASCDHTQMDDTSDFSTLALSPQLKSGLDALGYSKMTAVQALSLPSILAGRDLIAQAPTGSGKTAAFGLGLLQQMDAGRSGTQALVLCPTRELADQVGKQLRKLAIGIPNLKLSILCGGIPLAPQLASLTHAPHIVVGTPGRVLELTEKGALDLSAVSVFVLDEADRMLDMGFEEDIRALSKRMPKQRMGLLFSATFPDAIRALGTALLRDPVEVAVDAVEHRPDITARFIHTDPAKRVQQLAALLMQYRPQSTVVFCNMRRDTVEVEQSLSHYGFSALSLHGDMEQRDREEVLVRFANRSCSVLVASDVAARGLDIDGIDAVINYELPTDADTYLHRIGRTGRAGRAGLALSLVADSEDGRARVIDLHLGKATPWETVAAIEGRPRAVPQAPMVTLRIDAGRTDKLRPGDIVGALTGDVGLKKEAIGKIDVFATRSYVAIAHPQAGQTLEKLRNGKIKGRKLRVHRL